MRTFGIVIWVLIAVYSVLCVLLPPLRIIYWKGSDAKIGALSYSGVALLLASPLLLISEIIPRANGFFLFPIMLGSFLIVVIGYFVDVKKI